MKMPIVLKNHRSSFPGSFYLEKNNKNTIKTWINRYDLQQ